MKFDIIRAWKDETYRQNLSNEQLGMLPANPAGELELTEAELQSVSGGWDEGSNSFDGGFGGTFFRNDQEFVNSGAVVCANPIFSNNNVRNVVCSRVRIKNICVNFN